MRKLKILLMTAIMVIGLAVPAFASEETVDLTFYKDGTYPENPVISHSDETIESAYLDRKPDGNTDLVITTKWFKKMWLYGIMTQMKYTSDEGEKESNYHLPELLQNGQLRLPLAVSTVGAYDTNGEVELELSQARAYVEGYLYHSDDYVAVDAVISKLK